MGSKAETLARRMHTVAHGGDNCAYGGRSVCFVWQRMAEGIDAARIETCTWAWTHEERAGFWEVECKQDEDCPVSLLHEGAKFCAFCGNPLIVEGEA